MNPPPAHLLSRRDILRAGLACGTAAAFTRAMPARASTDGPILKAIPSTGEQLPVIGIGTNSFRAANLQSLRPLLQRFAGLGATVIDTAALYGDSESTIGQALADLDLRKQMFIATKFMGGAIPMMGPAPQRYDAESFEHSLEALQTDHVDLMQVHGMNGIEKLMPLLIDWKKAGRIRYIGATTSILQDHPQMIECMKQYPLDFVQVDYSIANRGAASTILPLALERRIAVLANMPLGGRDGGNLLRDIARPLPSWAAELGTSSWAQYMLKYVISHPAVTCAIPGSTRLEHLEDNQKAARGVLVDDATRQRMEQHWDHG
jgi:aryl-alcohol dehydrogenase-like predicted oxidoreductase